MQEPNAEDSRIRGKLVGVQLLGSLYAAMNLAATKIMRAVDMLYRGRSS